jgi:lipoate-protein ligase B
MPPSMKVHVHWMKLMKSQIIQKCQIFEILKGRVAKQKTHFLKSFDKKICSMGSKCLTLDANHMCRK